MSRKGATWFFFRRLVLRELQAHHQNNAVMLKNFFKVAFRNLWKQKGYSFLNIFGLAMGMTCSLLILLWIRDEKSVDGFHANGDRLYSIYERQYYDGKIEAGYYTPGILADELKKFSGGESGYC
jgi:putative ABC transport system permease protein